MTSLINKTPTSPRPYSHEPQIEEYSPKFNATDADIAFRSSDRIVFKIHRVNLETSTGGFPPSGFETRGEIVTLTETSTTLELLFQYIYPMPQPDLATVQFDTVANVAEAAEKYLIYPAMYVCKLVMGMALPGSALEVFAYAGRHGHEELLTRAAPYLIGKPLHEVVAAIPGHLIVPWIKYHSSWEKQLQNARAYPSRNIHSRQKFPTSIINYIAKLEDVKVLSDLSMVFGDTDNPSRSMDEDDYGQRYVRSWKAAIHLSIEGLKPFCTYL